VEGQPADELVKTKPALLPTPGTSATTNEGRVEGQSAASQDTTEHPGPAVPPPPAVGQNTKYDIGKLLLQVGLWSTILLYICEQF